MSKLAFNGQYLEVGSFDAGRVPANGQFSTISSADYAGAGGGGGVVADAFPQAARFFPSQALRFFPNPIALRIKP